MAVFALVPVFNRLHHTRTVIECLRRQVDTEVRIVVIDDGSTDGTQEYLADQTDITVFRGDGNMWWAGAIEMALGKLLPKATDADYFLFVNNDTTFDNHFVAALVSASRMLGQGIVGGVLRDVRPPNELLSIGPRVDIWRMRIWDKAQEIVDATGTVDDGIVAVDALPGRGVLFPKQVFDQVGTMRTWCLPHYHADYELSWRASKAGFPVAVSMSASVYSLQEFGNDTSRFGWWTRNFSKRSAANILRYLCFYSMIGSWPQRITAVPRFAYFWLRNRARKLSELLQTNRKGG